MRERCERGGEGGGGEGEIGEGWGGEKSEWEWGEGVG